LLLFSQFPASGSESLRLGKMELRKYNPLSAEEKQGGSHDFMRFLFGTPVKCFFNFTG